MSQLGEQPVIGHLSLLEILLLKAIVTYCVFHGIETTPDNVHHMYSQSCDLANQCTAVQFPIYPRSINTVKHFLSNVFNAINLLIKLLK